MAALSTKDKLVLKLSRERVERWNRERLKPAKNPVPNEAGEVKPIRCRSVQWGGTITPDEVIQPDKLETLYRASDGCKVRTMSDKLGDARLGAARRGLEHSQGHGDSVQVICYDPSRDYVDMHGAFAALRDKDVKALPPKLRRAYERAKHRASVANNVKPE